MRQIRWIVNIVLSGVIAGLVVNLAGCAIKPRAIIDQPTSASLAPAQPKAVVTNPGGIFQSASYRPIFEDIRARNVGDTIIITIAENTASSTKAGTSTSKTSATSYAAPNLFGGTAQRLARLGVNTKTASTLAEQGNGNFSNTFSGTISVEIIEVMSNGNFKVSGEKELAFDRTTEYVRFSGVVSPSNIAAGNIVPSYQVADAKLEYRTNSHLDTSEAMSIMNRFFLSVIPF